MGEGKIDGGIRHKPSVYLIIEQQGCNIQHKEDSQLYCNNFAWGQTATRSIMSDHFIIYANIKSLCTTPDTNMALYVDYISIKKGKKSRKAARMLKDHSRQLHNSGRVWYTGNLKHSAQTLITSAAPSSCWSNCPLWVAGEWEEWSVSFSSILNRQTSLKRSCIQDDRTKTPSSHD